MTQSRPTSRKQKQLKKTTSLKNAESGIHIPNLEDKKERKKVFQAISSCAEKTEWHKPQ